MEVKRMLEQLKKYGGKNTTMRVQDGQAMVRLPNHKTGLAQGVAKLPDPVDLPNGEYNLIALIGAMTVYPNGSLDDGFWSGLDVRSVASFGPVWEAPDYTDIFRLPTHPKSFVEYTATDMDRPILQFGDLSRFGCRMTNGIRLIRVPIECYGPGESHLFIPKWIAPKAHKIQAVHRHTDHFFRSEDRDVIIEGRIYITAKFPDFSHILPDHLDTSTFVPISPADITNFHKTMSAAYPGTEFIMNIGSGRIYESEASFMPLVPASDIWVNVENLAKAVKPFTHARLGVANGFIFIESDGMEAAIAPVRIRN